ncbi:type IX secretion system histidine kinase PorY [Winogradskyella forsetii]|uniref:sensor histidine kinase n=1 Tax=Winogradskyella forsetii TaxID=2686077 RepID=UPI001C537375|nr:HAMP domain-containing sensor histidine kinase [Winogradskyella forsetii]
MLSNEIEEELYSNKSRVERILLEDPSIKGIPPIMEVQKVLKAEQLKINDTLIYDPSQKEMELFKQLSETKEINGEYYLITVRAMVIESEDILFAIVFTFVGIVFLAFIFLFYLNKSKNRKIWEPFFVNLDRLKKFSIKSSASLTFEDSDILEFHDLNTELISLTSKIKIDYRNLKQFTEDVSHEMQTPLAIMQAKIDTVINDNNISETQFAKFSSLQEDIQRLKQLNKKLILLAKIDNNQFQNSQSLYFNKILKESIESLKELTVTNIELIEQNDLRVDMDKSLAIILCNNLLSNAIKHNISGKPIVARVSINTIQVENVGTVALSKPHQIFERFYKESNKEDSTGLGLSIVKKICDYYGFVPSYRFRESKHIFQINFNSKL